jgi:hypothetical protein
LPSAVRPDPPSGLAGPGRRLWRAAISDLSTGWTLDAVELDHLARACSAADRIAALEAEVERDGVMVSGSRGQRVVNPCIGEIRQLDVVRMRLLDALDLDDPKAAIGPSTPAQEKARHAAQARWARNERPRSA